LKKPAFRIVSPERITDGLRVLGWTGIALGKVIRFGVAKQNAEVSRPLLGGFEQTLL
jgi:hypothetical protein